MKSRKRDTTDGIELPNQDKIRTLGKNDANKYLGISVADTIKQMQMKDKIKKNISGELGNYSRQNSLAETFKGINIWAVSLVRYSGPFSSGPEMNLNKWTKELEN